MKISQRTADYINHAYGNVKKNGAIWQYTFKEGDDFQDVLEFIEAYYPDIKTIEWVEFSDL